MAMCWAPSAGHWRRST